MDLTDIPLNLVDEKLVRKHRALPVFRRGNRLFVAVSDPHQPPGPRRDPLQHRARHRRGPGGGVQARRRHRQGAGGPGYGHVDILDADLDNIDIATDDDDKRDDSDLNVDDAPIVRYVNKILVDAIGSAASDIHFEPYEKYFRIRFRQDGMLREVANPPVNIAARLVARLKVMSRMNIAERRVPQDGRIKLKLSRNRDIDFRVNTLPTLYGEKVVLRILDASAALVGVDQLGFEPSRRRPSSRPSASPTA
jgi:type IV pilus assembly protein PilB